MSETHWRYHEWASFGAHDHESARVGAGQVTTGDNGRARDNRLCRVQGPDGPTDGSMATAGVAANVGGRAGTHAGLPSVV